MDNQQQAAAQQAAQATNEAETIQVDDLDTFVKLLSRWHTSGVKRLEHLLQIPDGQVIQIGDEPELLLAGDMRRVFVAGVNMALMELGILPFAVELEDAADTAATTPQLEAQEATGG